MTEWALNQGPRVGGLGPKGRFYPGTGPDSFSHSRELNSLEIYFQADSSLLRQVHRPANRYAKRAEKALLRLSVRSDGRTSEPGVGR
jgi:hypothetical protein